MHTYKSYLHELHIYTKGMHHASKGNKPTSYNMFQMLISQPASKCAYTYGDIDAHNLCMYAL